MDPTHIMRRHLAQCCADRSAKLHDDALQNLPRATELRLSPPIVQVSDLTFDYPGFRALERVSLEIQPGTVTALVGLNGAG